MLRKKWVMPELNHVGGQYPGIITTEWENRFGMCNSEDLFDILSFRSVTFN
jgi:hypothetical protein